MDERIGTYRYLSVFDEASRSSFPRALGLFSSFCCSRRSPVAPPSSKRKTTTRARAHRARRGTCFTAFRSLSREPSSALKLRGGICTTKSIVSAVLAGTLLCWPSRGPGLKCSCEGHGDHLLRTHRRSDPPTAEGAAAAQVNAAEPTEDEVHDKAECRTIAWRKKVRPVATTEPGTLTMSLN